MFSFSFFRYFLVVLYQILQQNVNQSEKRIGDKQLSVEPNINIKVTNA